MRGELSASSPTPGTTFRPASPPPGAAEARGVPPQSRGIQPGLEKARHRRGVSKRTEKEKKWGRGEARMMVVVDGMQQNRTAV